MFYVKRVCSAHNNHQPVKVGRIYKTVAAAKTAAQKYIAAVVVEQATGAHVSYGKGGVMAWHKMA
mgnify:CR=1 FL=1